MRTDYKIKYCFVIESNWFGIIKKVSIYYTESILKPSYFIRGDGIIVFTIKIKDRKLAIDEFKKFYINYVEKILGKQ